MEEDWNSCGPDTLHATFKEGSDRTPADLALLLQEFQLERDLPTGQVVRDKGVSGFASAAVDQAAGLRLDWTRAGDEGANEGFFCLQVKGQWFASADGETTADLLQLLEAYGIYRVTRLDIQQTTCTTKYLTPWWIKAFDAGMLRVIGKNVWEPRGRKSSADDYPAGATLYHGSRTSERFVRQYDKHKQQQEGLARRRDEVELKGRSARDCWEEMQSDLALSEIAGIPRGVRLHAFSKRSLRAYIPIRDTSRWAGKALPKNWASVAKEPNNWTALFEEEAKAIKPAPGRVTSLLKSLRYAQSNFGAAVAAQACAETLRWEKRGLNADDAQTEAFASIVYGFINGANEDRVHEFFTEMPPSNREQLEDLWLEYVRLGGDALDAERDNDAVDRAK